MTYFGIFNNLDHSHTRPIAERVAMQKAVRDASRRIQRGFRFRGYSTRKAAEAAFATLPADVQPLYHVAEHDYL